MLAMLDVQGQSNFDCLNDNIEAQIKYVYDAIDSDSDYKAQCAPGFLTQTKSSEDETFFLTSYDAK